MMGMPSNAVKTDCEYCKRVGIGKVVTQRPTERASLMSLWLVMCSKNLLGLNNHS